jgi:hypothetical protein
MKKIAKKVFLGLSEIDKFTRLQTNKLLDYTYYIVYTELNEDEVLNYFNSNFKKSKYESSFEIDSNNIIILNFDYTKERIKIQFHKLEKS